MEVPNTAESERITYQDIILCCIKSFILNYRGNFNFYLFLSLSNRFWKQFFKMPGQIFSYLKVNSY